MVEAVYLFGLASLLAGFLFWKKIPRPIAVDFWVGTILVFIVCLEISMRIFDHFANRFLDGILPYLPPVVPACVFLAWRLQRLRRRR
jgi:hypothetical protein